MKSEGGYTVKVQQIWGELPPAIEGKATVAGDTLTFDVDVPDRKRLTFKGKITPDEIRGRFVDGRLGSDGKADIHWRRVAIDVFSIGDCSEILR